MSYAMLPPLESGQGGCLCCPPKPITASLEMQPHPGFGMLNLLRDGETPDWWSEYCDISRWVYIPGEWTTTQTYRGETVEYFTGDWVLDWLHDAVTLGEIEECVAEDSDHDWRLHIYGPMSEYTYQRQGPASWVLVEKGMGFA